MLRVFFSTGAALLFLSSFLLAEEPLQEPTITDVQIPSSLQGNLLKEMITLRDRMTKIIDPLVRGQWAKVKKLTSDIPKKLRFDNKLKAWQFKTTVPYQIPDDFFVLYNNVRVESQKLNQAAGQKDPTLALEAYEALLQNCIQCHSSYASYKFQGFR